MNDRREICGTGIKWLIYFNWTHAGRSLASPRRSPPGSSLARPAAARRACYRHVVQQKCSALGIVVAHVLGAGANTFPPQVGRPPSWFVNNKTPSGSPPSIHGAAAVAIRLVRSADLRLDVNCWTAASRSQCSSSQIQWHLPAFYPSGLQSTAKLFAPWDFLGASPLLWRETKGWSFLTVYIFTVLKTS
jgi:hypothetical protein